MKRIVILVLFLSLSGHSMAQLAPLALEQRVMNSNLVFEGKVMSKSSFWNKERTHIYTANVVSVYKVFKGDLNNSTLELITVGGIVGDVMERVSYGLELQEGQIGVFTCIPNSASTVRSSKNLQVKPYGEVQGFIKYDLERGTARDVFKEYKNISEDVYPVLKKLTKSNFKIMKQADFKLKQ